MNGPSNVPDKEGRPIGPWRTGLQIIERVVALALAFLLLRSAFAHLGNPYYFLSTVYSYDLTGVVTGQAVAVVLPFLQAVVAVCLLARAWLSEAYFVSFVMFTIFLGVQLLAVKKGLTISCGCFGAAETLQVGRTTITLAGLAALGSVVGWCLASRLGASRNVSGALT